MFFLCKACANPLLYGWLNDNFRKEFHKIGTSFVLARSSKNDTRATERQSMRQRPTAKMVVQQQQQLPLPSSPVEKPAVGDGDGGSGSVRVGSPAGAGASTAVTMLALPTSTGRLSSHYRTEVTVVTHLVPDPSPTPCPAAPVTVYRVNEINSTASSPPEHHL